MAALNLGALFLALAVIVAGAGAARWGFRKLGLPGVVGEILLGVLLGPSLLGWLWPVGHGALFPPTAQPVLQALSWLGLVLFVYGVGLEMKWGGTARPVFLVAAGGLVVPMAVGLVLPAQFPHWFFPDGGSPTSWAMVGIVLTVSALPVLARVLQGLGMLGSPIGSMAMGAATLDDVVGWILIAAVAAVRSALVPSTLATNIALVVVFGAALLAGDRLLRPRLRALEGPLPSLAFVGVLALALLSAWLTHTAGLNAVLGPLAVGALVARYPALREDSVRRMGDVTRILLLPVFFVVSGADVDLRLLPMPEGLVPLVVVVLVASCAKILGCSLGARLAGMRWREGLAAGSLLNVRGAVGLVVVKVGYDAGVFSPEGYALLVLVVAITTMTSPLLARALLRAPRPAPRARTDP